MRSTDKGPKSQMMDTHDAAVGASPPAQDGATQGRRTEVDRDTGRPTALGCPAWSSSRWGSATYDRCVV
jgi:hypothetical protein